MTLIEIARLGKFIRELTGQNDGAWVEAIQRVTGNKKGDSWCASYVSVVLALYYGGPNKNPLPMTASCDELLEFARKKGWLTETPKVNNVFLVMKNEHDAVHTGFVAEVKTLSIKTIEGNTNDDGGRDGYGVFERSRFRLPGRGLLYIDLPIKVVG
jgi:hypothetical protein